MKGGIESGEITPQDVKALINHPEVQKILNDPEMMKKATEFLGTVGLDPAKVKEMLDSLEDEKSTNAAKNDKKDTPAMEAHVHHTPADKKGKRAY